jgi:hypothetical protein
VTVAEWQDQQSLDAAKAKVQDDYTKNGFDPKAFSERLGITLERNIFTPIGK